MGPVTLGRISASVARNIRLGDPFNSHYARWSEKRAPDGDIRPSSSKATPWCAVPATQGGEYLVLPLNPLGPTPCGPGPAPEAQLTPLIRPAPPAELLVAFTARACTHRSRPPLGPAWQVTWGSSNLPHCCSAPDNPRLQCSAHQSRLKHMLCRQWRDACLNCATSRCRTSFLLASSAESRPSSACGSRTAVRLPCAPLVSVVCPALRSSRCVPAGA